MQGRHFKMTMARAYVYNKVPLLLAVFVGFKVLNHKDKKRGKGKTRQWIRRRDERGYFNNIVKELAIEDAAEYEDYKDMMRMSHAVFQRILSYIEQDISSKQVLGGNKVISPKERLVLTISHKQIVLLCYRLCIHGDHSLRGRRNRGRGRGAREARKNEGDFFSAPLPLPRLRRPHRLW